VKSAKSRAKSSKLITTRYKLCFNICALSKLQDEYFVIFESRSDPNCLKLPQNDENQNQNSDYWAVRGPALATIRGHSSWWYGMHSRQLRAEATKGRRQAAKLFHDT
jgi:hypothetical protein